MYELFVSICAQALTTLCILDIAEKEKKNLSKKILKVKCHYQGLPQISYLLNEILIFNIRKAFRTDAMIIWVYFPSLFFIYLTF